MYMFSKFERPQGSAEYGRNLEEYIIKMNKALDELSEGTADLQQGKELIYSPIKEHSYDHIKGRLNALRIFSKGEVLSFVENYSEISPKFSKMIKEITNWLETAINTMKGKSSHESFLSDAKFMGKFIALNFALYDL